MTTREAPFDEWKRIILELPDDLFFSLMRLYLGEIKTPFHKPRIVEKIIAYLSDTEITERIAALTDRYDAEVLTAIDLLRNPDAGTLFRIFQGERDYFSFHNHLMNLSERLLIYTVPDGNVLQINPYLYPVLKERVLTPRLLFPPADEAPEDETGDSAPKQPVSLREEHIWSALSFVQHQGIQIKANGTIKKNTIEQLRPVFPALCSGDDLSEIYRLINCLLRLRLMKLKSGRMQFHEEGIRRMLRMHRPHRLGFLWAAASLEPVSSWPPCHAP